MSPVTSPTTGADPNTPSDPVNSTARSRLYEICAKSHWKHPVFVCCNEQGPSNRRWFTSKVIFEMRKDGSRMVVESMGKPQSNKKIAAESAAEGALWYLEHLGYPKEADKSKKTRFTSKVIFEIKKDGSRMVVECMGKPQSNKKIAAESAAEGALWYLMHLGYPKEADKSNKTR